MTAPRSAGPRGGSCAIVERRSHEFRITLPPAGLWQLLRTEWATLAVGALVLLYVGMFARLLGDTTADTPLARVVVALLVVGIPATVVLARLALRWRRVVVRASAERLTITVQGPLGTREYYRPRAAVRAIGAEHALWIVTDEEREEHLNFCDDEELYWLAGVLRGVLRVPERAPPGRGECVVLFSDRSWESPRPGLLRARRGELMIFCHAFAPHPHIQFRVRPARVLPSLRQMAVHSPCTVAPEEVTCRVWEDGTASLQIKPAGIENPFLIWCRHKEPLERALACFWGARELDEPQWPERDERFRGEDA